MAELLDVTQPSINRYEHGKAVPIEVLIGYADYFDVSMDYITCRCDEPQGKLYQARPPISDNPELGKFIEMCFDPHSPMNGRLKGPVPHDGGWKMKEKSKMISAAL